MSEIPEARPPEDIAPLLRLGLEEEQEPQAADPNATIMVTAPTPFTEGSGNSGGQSGGGSRGWSPPSVAELQKILPQYEITAFIARGGMGAVYKGTQKTLKRPVAIKVLPPEIEDGDMQFAARFKHEAQAMAQLSHPNIVAVFDAAETADGLLYFVMEFIEGTDVAQLIASEGIIEPKRAIQITTAVCEALAFAHEEGIIHRDIKPSNIMLDKKGRVKVADFGLAKTVNQEHSLLTGSNVAMGTPDFIAPEAMIPGIKVDQRADIYAVGVMLYQMLTGHIPRGRFELPSGVAPQVDKAFDAVVDKAMQTDREKRYSTALEMKKDVESAAIAKEGSAGTHARPHSIGSAAARKEAPKNGRLPLLLAAAVVVLGGAAWFVLRDSSRQEQAVQVTLPADAGLQASSGELSRSASLSVSNSPAFPPGHWRDAMNEGLLKEMIKQAGPTDKGYLLPAGQHWRFPVEPLKAGAIRIRTTVGDSPLPELCFYLGDERAAHYRARISKDLKTCALRYSPRPDDEQVLTTAPIELKPGQAHDLMLMSTSSQLWVILDGEVILNAPKAEAGAGRLALVTPNDAKNIRLLKAEYVSLDGLSEAEALKEAGAPQSTGWIKGDFMAFDPATVDKRAKLIGRQLHLQDRCVWRPEPLQSFQNAAVRVSCIWRDENRDLKLAIGDKEKMHFAKLFLPNTGGQAVTLGIYEGTDKSFRNVSLRAPLRAGERVTFQFARIGSTLFTWVNDRLVSSEPNVPAANPGPVQVYAAEARIDSFEYLPLDGLSEAEARKLVGVD